MSDSAILRTFTLSVQPPMDRVFDIGPYPIGGDGDTVCQTAYVPEDSYYPGQSGRVGIRY